MGRGVVDMEKLASYAPTALVHRSNDPKTVEAVEKLGIDEGCKPFIYFPKGAVFGSRSPKSSADGTFFTCITVPRFSYDGFELLDREQVTALCPEADAFWTK